MRRVALVAMLLLSSMAQAQTPPLKSGIRLQDMDVTCKPCEDFWRFANGGWVDKNPIPARFSTWGVFTQLAEDNREHLREIAEAAAAQSQPGAAPDQRKLGDFYASCTDTGKIDAVGLTPLQPDIDRINGIRTRQDIVRVVGWLQEFNSPSDGSNVGLAIGPFRFTTRPDPRDPSRVIGQIDEHEGAGGARTSIFSLPDRDYYFKSDAKSVEIRDEFVEYVANMLTLAGTGRESAAAQARVVLAFETALAESALAIADRRDPDRTLHVMDAAAATSLTPAFDWKAFLLSTDLPATTMLNVAQPELLKRFGQLLASTPIDDWKLWLRWRLLSVSAPYLAKPFADEEFHFTSVVLMGVQERQPRWRTCVQVLDRDMGDALGAAYVAKYFPPEAKRRMGAMVENLRVAMRNELQRADWLDSSTRQNAIKKLDAFRVKIGYPDRWRDYSSLKIDRNNYFQNVRAAWQHTQRRRLAQIGKAPDRGEWNMTPPTVNAYSNSSGVEIVFPAGILQPPFFDLTADDAVNYGAIGAIIGHEMGHQFDDSGSKYDSTGARADWWTSSDRAKFDTRASCVVDQFNSIDVGEGQHHNGRLVLGEALGDLGGLTIAYRAYRRSLPGGAEPPAIDGYTGDQRFFIAFARAWGTVARPEATRLQLATNPHPLAKYRANATLQNIPEFHRAFKCQIGDAMVRPPAQQCKLW
jgi:endothelin-converting enzyme/putative endopeptidase